MPIMAQNYPTWQKKDPQISWDFPFKITYYLNVLFTKQFWAVVLQMSSMPKMPAKRGLAASNEKITTDQDYDDPVHSYGVR